MVRLLRSANTDLNFLSYTMSDLVSFTYTNHRGETAVRKVKPISWRYGTSEYYPIPVLLLEGICQDRKETREFAVSNITAWH